MFADRSLCERRLAVLCLFIYIVAVTLGAFTGGLWATLGIGLATVLFFGVWFIDKKMPQPPKELTQFACVALACFAMELPLSSQVALSGKVWVQLASIFLTLILLTSQRLQTATLSRSFVPVVALAAGIGAVALGFELLSGGTLIHLLKKPGASLTEYNRGIAHLVILAFPLFAGLWISGKRSVAVVLALVLLFPACLTKSRTAKLALIVGVACAAAAFYRPLWARRGLAAGAVAIMGWPFYAQYIFSTAYPDGSRICPPRGGTAWKFGITFPIASPNGLFSVGDWAPPICSIFRSLTAIYINSPFKARRMRIISSPNCGLKRGWSVLLWDLFFCF